MKSSQTTEKLIPELSEVSIFNIGGFDHDENIISNFYEFFLHKDNAHGLNSIFFDALIAVIARKNNKIPLEWGDIRIKREASAGKRKRIDLLIQEIDGKEKKAIIIESKINAIVNNDLDHYWKSVKLPAERKFGVLLHHNFEKSHHDEYTNITHAEWMKEVRTRIKKSKLNNFYSLIGLQLADLFDITKEQEQKRDKVFKNALKNSKTIIEDYNGSQKKSKKDVLMSDNQIDLLQMSKQQLFNGLIENLSLIKLHISNYKKNKETLSLYFTVKNVVFCFFIEFNQDINFGIVSIYLEYPLVFVPKQNEAIKSYSKQLKISKSLLNKGILKDFQKLTDSGDISFARKNYSGSELIKYGATNEILFKIINAEWVPLIEQIEQDLNNLKLK